MEFSCIFSKFCPCLLYFCNKPPVFFRPKVCARPVEDIHDAVYFVRGGPFLHTFFPICIRCKLGWVPITAIHFKSGSHARLLGKKYPPFHGLLLWFYTPFHGKTWGIYLWISTHFIEPTCTTAQWALMHCFSVCLSVTWQKFTRKKIISRKLLKLQVWNFITICLSVWPSVMACWIGIGLLPLQVGLTANVKLHF